MTYEYISISFAGTSPSGKTKIYHVINNSHGYDLGDIRFYGPWRQYVFQPLERAIFSKGCLTDIADFIRSL